MALIEVGMTHEEAISITQPIPAGKYRLTFAGFFRKDKDNPSSVLQDTKKGGKMLVGLFKPANPEIQNKSNLFFNAVIGTFSYAELLEAVPQLSSGTGVDEDAAKNVEVGADVTVDAVLDSTGADTGRKRNGISKLYNIALCQGLR